jgi:hypothetical protein
MMLASFITRLLGIDVPVSSESRWEIALRNMPPVWVVVLIPFLVLGYTFFVYKREAKSVPWSAKAFLGTVRCLLIFIMLLLLFEPILTVEKESLQQPYLLVLVDESLSMSLKDKFPDRKHREKLAFLTGISALPASMTAAEDDELAKLNREDMVNRIVSNPKLKLLDACAKKSRVRVLSFSDILHKQPKIGAFAPTGPLTALGDAVVAATDELRGQPITGIIIFSDGQYNTGKHPEEAMRILAERYAQMPIYTVGIGSLTESRDIAISKLKAPEYALAKDIVTFEFVITSKGYDGEMAEVSVSEGDRVVSSMNIRLEGQGKEQAVTLQYTPDKPGEYDCTVATPVRNDELVEKNNKVKHHLTVVDQKMKILFVDGYPRWEYRYLKNAFIRDKEDPVRIACFLISADADFPQEGNLDMDPSTPEIDGLREFPGDPQTLFDFDVIILGDVNPEQLSTRTMSARDVHEKIVSFVEDLGGGVAFVAGPRDNPRSYRNTPLAKLIPVTLEDQDLELVEPGSTITESFTPSLTEDGRMHPLTRLEANPNQNWELWNDSDKKGDGLPGFYWYYLAKKAKPGAIVLAEHPTSSTSYGKRPIFAIQRVGRGRTFFSAVDSTWRWRWLRGDYYFYRFWKQTMKELRQGRLLGSKRYTVEVDKPEYTIKETVKIWARIFDVDYKPLKDPVVTATMIAPDETRVEVELKADPKITGEYRGTVEPDQDGNFNVIVGDPDMPKESGRTAFVVKEPAKEFDDPTMNSAILKTMATTSGGVFLPVFDADKLPASVKPASEIIEVEAREDDLWDSPLAYLLFALAITVEWVVRKLVRLL